MIDLSWVLDSKLVGTQLKSSARIYNYKKDFSLVGSST